MANQLFAGFLYNNAGTAVNGATVELFDRNTTTPVRATTNTDSNGYWSISHATEGRFDVRITNGSSVRFLKYDDEIQLNSLEVANLRVRNPADTFEYDIVPAAIAADRQLNLPLITATGTLIATPSVEDLDMGGFDIDNAGFLILNAATAPAGTEVYAVNDNTGDLTLNALTGKTINLAIAGTDEVVISATNFQPAADDGNALGVSGTAWADLFLASGAIINFAAGDVTVTHTSNQLTFAGGNLVAAAGSIIFTGGETANGNMTDGVTIQMNGADNEALTLKSTDVANGAPLGMEADTFAAFYKSGSTIGGLRLDVVAEDALSPPTFQLRAIGGQATGVKTTAGRALIEHYATEHDGAGSVANITADGNIWGVRARIGAADVLRIMTDEDGDFFSVVAAQTFDEFDDLALVEAVDVVRSHIDEPWKEFIKEQEQTLIDLRILGGPVVGMPHDNQGMLNVTQLQRLHNGALRQIGTRVKQLEIQLEETQQLLKARD